MECQEPDRTRAILQEFRDLFQSVSVHYLCVSISNIIAVRFLKALHVWLILEDDICKTMCEMPVQLLAGAMINS